MNCIALFFNYISDFSFSDNLFNAYFFFTVGPSFILTLHARVDTNEKHLLGVTFNGNGDGESEQLLCKIQKFEDIDKIVIKEGVATVSSLFYKFK